MLQIGDSVLISPNLTMCEIWTSAVVIDVENNPYRGIVISAQTADGNIFFSVEEDFKLSAQIPSAQNENDIQYEMSLDVALDIIGTLRMMKISAISEEKNTSRKAVLIKELEVLTAEERIAQGMFLFDGWEVVRLSVFDKIVRLYAPSLKKYYAELS